MKTLHLNLKKKWFDMIASGEKKEEYREIKDYWVSKFVAFLWVSDFDTKSHVDKILLGEYNKLGLLDDWETITFSNGYSKNRRQFVIEYKGLEVRKGNKCWGANEGQKYFVLNLGKILKRNFKQ